ncbi:hypothetical protein [Tenacibaculum finnmarkense]|uniref:hypothetical protein n=1 Tax=Tenacibaculum finnmarkense TaxID=2781243 RepID=UPI00187BB2B5|nr:hypothetical protein [Tenacibaculum finnmarkense]MBE7659921.1 hypothetical protein [Tenacibaculum finnmarkense genomovar finnmarkense]MCG8251607.1 hypothetical protein [Tenacibaculum finnmarkense genomovar finnmarkense]MCG8815135.1 hypothetical protein [Tenacibaculum finnmarkense]MCG8820065.1 hypothetical protein [Tenacibaculum finnmarkense]
MRNYKQRLFTLIITFILISLNTNAQEFKVVDNKGTINTVFKNNVTTTTTSTAPLNPVEGDVWFNDVDSEIKIYDGAIWKKLSDTNNLTTNFYNANGTLTSHRVLTGSTGSGGKYDLSFNDIRNFTVHTDVTEILSSGKTKIGSSVGDVTITAFGNILLDNNTSIAKSLGIAENLTVDENFKVKKKFIDASNNAGANGQVLSSTGTTTKWVDNIKNKVTATATSIEPSNSIEGDVWFDTVNNEIKIYDADEPIVANQWKKLSNITAAANNIYTTNGNITADRTITGNIVNRFDIGYFKAFMISNTEFITFDATEMINLQAINGVNLRSSTIADENFQVKKSFLDKDGDSGIAGQVLSSTGIGTDWIDNAAHTGTPGSIFFAGTDGKPTENNIQLTWDNTALKLYVGAPFNTTDTNKLTVNGTARATRFRSSNGTVGDPAFKFSGDNNTGMYRMAADQLGFTTGGVNALSIDATQNISIPKNLSVTGTFADTTGDVGTAGQVLSSTGIGTDWVDAIASGNRGSVDNIYTENGSLTSDRLVTGDNKSFRFTDLTDFYIDDTNYIALQSTGYLDLRAASGINVVDHARFVENITVDKGYKDSTGSFGGNGQVLSSTSTATKWVDATASGNIYTENGRLTTARTLDANNLNFSLNNIDEFKVNSNTAEILSQNNSKFGSINGGVIIEAANNIQLNSNATITENLTIAKNLTVNENIWVKKRFKDTSGSPGSFGQILTSTTSGTNWIDNPALNNWLTTGNSGTTTANFLGTTDDVKMQIRSNNIPMLEFGRRQTLGLTQPYPDYTDIDQSVVHVKGANGVSALQFQASGTTFYKPMFFTTSNGSFRLKGSAGKSDFFEIGSAGPDNQGRLEFIVGDDGDEPMIFKSYNYRGAEFHRELFRVQGSADARESKTRFGINLNPQEVPIAGNLDNNANDASFKKANSTFQVAGSISKSIIKSDTDFTLTEDHYTLIAKDQSNTRTITLPAASSVTGRIYIIKTNWYRGVNLNITYITRTTNTTNYIPSRSTVQLQSDGTDWQQIN